VAGLHPSTKPAFCWPQFGERGARRVAGQTVAAPRRDACQGTAGRPLSGLWLAPASLPRLTESRAACKACSTGSRARDHAGRPNACGRPSQVAALTRHGGWQHFQAQQAGPRSAEWQETELLGLPEGVVFGRTGAQLPGSHRPLHSVPLSLRLANHPKGCPVSRSELAGQKTCRIVYSNQIEWWSEVQCWRVVAWWDGTASDAERSEVLWATSTRSRKS